MITDLYKIESSEISDGKGAFVLELNSESEIYKAHFPGQPITPGACTLQMVDDLLHKVPGAETLRLAEVVNLKFLSPIDPRVATRMDIELTYNAETNQVKAEVKHNGVVSSKLSLKYKACSDK